MEVHQVPTNRGQTIENEPQLIEVINALVDGDFLSKSELSTDLGKALQRLSAKLQQDYSADLDRVVVLSMKSNDTGVQSARLLYNLKNIDNRVHDIAKSAEQMRAAAELIQSYSEQISQENQSSIVKVDSVQSSLDNTVKVFQTINESVSTNNDKIKDLSTFSVKVRDISEEIKGISFQINLLSLNASLEAARAGEKGAGFSVVAQEMRMLARRSTEATKKITGLAHHFEEQMSEISEALQCSITNVHDGKSSINEVETQISEMKNTMAYVSESITQISSAISQQNTASGNVAKEVGKIAKNTTLSVKNTAKIVGLVDQMQKHVNQHIAQISHLNLPNKIIKLAQSDHVIWKKRLANMISGTEGLYEQELADHHSCRLGRWYNQVKDPRLRNHPAFTELLAPHELVHTHGKLAVAAYNEGNHQEALKQIDLVEKASIDVLRILKSLEVA